MARFKTINDICNQVGVESGLARVTDVFASSDESYIQLVALANAVGYELLQLPWQQLRRAHQIITKPTDDGRYKLPDDFAYMLEQTGWDQVNNNPLFGPLSPQKWAYLKGRDLVDYTIYASFRLAEGEFWLFPYAESSLEPPDGLEVTFEYTSRNWVSVKGADDEYSDSCVNTSDVVLYEPYLFERVLKVRFLESRGFDTTAAASQMAMAIDSWFGKDKSAPVLNSSNPSAGIPYIDAYCNTPDTGYGR